MKKLILLSLILMSCGAPDEGKPVIIIEPYTPDSLVILDTVPVEAIPTADSTMEKMNALINSTQHAENKIIQIKVLKRENIQLKQELIATKVQLEEVKAIAYDTTEDVKKKKRTLFQKIVDTIKKDTLK